MMDDEMNRQQDTNIRKSPNMKDDVCGSGGMNIYIYIYTEMIDCEAK